MFPLFTVILTTYKRPGSVLKSVESVKNQNYKNWRLIIVIDDTETNYSELIKLVEADNKTTLIKNEVNLGKNKSVNKALEIAHNESPNSYVVFLDDDDWLDLDCLETFAESLSTNPEYKWLVSQRSNFIDKVSLTSNKTSRSSISYLKDMLVLRRFSGETTHCISLKETSNCRMPFTIANGQEWVYFAEVSTKVGDFIYLPKTGTYSEGYLSDGLSLRNKNFRENWIIYKKLIKEISKRELRNVYIYTYLLIRFFKILIFK
jgi:glycosyltransferase involved in cell wall biosynthesis